MSSDRIPIADEIFAEIEGTLEAALRQQARELRDFSAEGLEVDGGLIDSIPVPEFEISLDDADRDAQDAHRIDEKYAQVLESDYFSLLDISPDASSDEIRQAIEARLSEFIPQRFSMKIATEYGVRLSLIAELLAEAYAVLCDPHVRQSYRAHIEPRE